MEAEDNNNDNKNNENKRQKTIQNENEFNEFLIYLPNEILLFIIIEFIENPIYVFNLSYTFFTHSKNYIL